MLIHRYCPIILLTLFALTAHAQWQRKQAPLMTRWAKDVTPDNAHPEYPRPQMVRKQWQNLNGLWDYAIVAKDDAKPESWAGQILVPFPVESALSGVMKTVGKDNRLWYRRSFTIPADWNNQRVLLHFGAVDWETTLWANGKEIGKHVGGYDPFSFDITDSIKRNELNEIVLSVWDPSTDGYQPIGKQHAKPSGIWYTATTGIWQTAWIEPVPEDRIQSLKIKPDFDDGSVLIESSTGGDPLKSIHVDVLDGTRVIASGNAGEKIKIPNPKPWSPDSPFLYGLRVSLIRITDLPDAAGNNKQIIETVESYFGLRKVSVSKDKAGITRLMLNNQFVFQFGPLDQGFWPDGLYTAPTEEAMKYDLEITKKVGMNMIRKHVKVEPATWYAACDRMGILVWQDMPSGDKHAPKGRGEITRNESSAKNFERELKALIDTHYNSPCIVMWVPFNEGWGQYDTIRIANWIKEYDPSRLVNCASGWNDYPAGDVHDEHDYRSPSSPKPEEKRAAVLGEFGGLGLPLEGHTWQSKGSWGYKNFTDRATTEAAYLALIDKLQPLIANPGLSAAIYTQTTDVEVEVNGLMTYDREIIKMDPGRLVEAHRKLYLSPETK